MPNRIIREGILDSERVNSLGWAAEVFYRRLISVVDDFGRFDGRAKMLRSRLYPIKDNVSDADVERWLADAQTSGLVRVYQSGGKPFLEITDFNQRTRSKESKYPPPDGHMTDICLTDDRHMRTYTETETETDTCVAGGTHTGASAIVEVPSLKEALAHGAISGIPDGYVTMWHERYGESRSTQPWRKRLKWSWDEWGESWKRKQGMNGATNGQNGTSDGLEAIRGRLHTMAGLATHQRDGRQIFADPEHQAKYDALLAEFKAKGGKVIGGHVK